MKKLLLSVLLVFSIGLISGQGALGFIGELDPWCSDGYNDDCKESEFVIWDKNRPLTWEDFQGTPGTFAEDEDFATLSADDTGAQIVTYLDSEWWWNKSSNIPCEYKITKVNVAASMSITESWFRPDAIEGEEDEILKHEQGHFDIAQIHAQKFIAEHEDKTFACPSGLYDNDAIDAILQEDWTLLIDERNAMDILYDKETLHHDNREEQAKWDKKIISILSTGGYVEEISIPQWIKNNAGWWASGEIPDSAFVNGIQFLIKEGIMSVS